MKYFKLPKINMKQIGTVAVIVAVILVFGRSSQAAVETQMGPLPPIGFCGDGVCERGAETSLDCPADCAEVQNGGGGGGGGFFGGIVNFFKNIFGRGELGPEGPGGGSELEPVGLGSEGVNGGELLGTEGITGDIDAAVLSRNSFYLGTVFRRIKLGSASQLTQFEFDDGGVKRAGMALQVADSGGVNTNIAWKNPLIITSGGSGTNGTVEIRGEMTGPGLPWRRDIAGGTPLGGNSKPVILSGNINDFVGIGTNTPTQTLTIGADGGDTRKSNFAVEMREMSKPSSTLLNITGTGTFQQSFRVAVAAHDTGGGSTKVSTSSERCDADSPSKGCAFGWSLIPGAVKYRVFVKRSAYNTDNIGVTYDYFDVRSTFIRLDNTGFYQTSSISDIGGTLIVSTPAGNSNADAYNGLTTPNAITGGAIAQQAYVNKISAGAGNSWLTLGDISNDNSNSLFLISNQANRGLGAIHRVVKAPLGSGPNDDDRFLVVRRTASDGRLLDWTMQTVAGPSANSPSLLFDIAERNSAGTAISSKRSLELLFNGDAKLQNLGLAGGGQVCATPGEGLLYICTQGPGGPSGPAVNDTYSGLSSGNCGLGSPGVNKITVYAIGGGGGGKGGHDGTSGQGNTGGTGGAGGQIQIKTIGITGSGVTADFMVPSFNNLNCVAGTGGKGGVGDQNQSIWPWGQFANIVAYLNCTYSGTNITACSVNGVSGTASIVKDANNNNLFASGGGVGATGTPGQGPGGNGGYGGLGTNVGGSNRNGGGAGGGGGAASTSPGTNNGDSGQNGCNNCSSGTAGAAGGTNTIIGSYSSTGGTGGRGGSKTQNGCTGTVAGNATNASGYGAGGGGGGGGKESNDSNTCDADRGGHGSKGSDGIILFVW
ncbi:hypothetical protein A3A09_01210 [Candidatus Nomurabacteria bacterium RIFCSPLOWO2_01_FULL_42_20]|uniref:Uncharacterized protein n=1 Tax=Candidatus Nomurabacteria bacterium RIFCSPHIGHO2_01_FULL_42_16 TaxID=1801743 RepID=A0A1F6VLU2_9BACT|nr:MAG: hypothetical protein A2824_00250 [Candidatus Nomurabacteria bacterium RIFCSPHIGHO2_01_FULL_42_16]OGI92621.1 MAG: hypothetical protein A3A09_01210 [Candidatus Nomurabacteria bacterium RIFCSPLOWO2_01_FULL_42_20]